MYIDLNEIVHWNPIKTQKIIVNIANINTIKECPSPYSGNSGEVYTEIVMNGACVCVSESVEMIGLKVFK